MPLLKNDEYTTDYIYSLPEGERAELIDGTLYNMAPTTSIHQELSLELSAEIRNYIKKKCRECTAYTAPYAVFLENNDTTYVEPDISVICDKNKLNDKGCNGAPEIFSFEQTIPVGIYGDLDINIAELLK